jgi:hypothetical protein
MTVNVEIPYADLQADGVETVFAFTFSLVDEFDLYVMVDGVLLVSTGIYSVEITDLGGEVTFVEAPAAGARVLIFRKTTQSQQVNYVEGEPFPVESHEKGFDKLTFILQELISGAWTGIDSNGDPCTLTFDLSVTAGTVTLTINNSGGTDAVLPPWVSGQYAGVFHGELTEEGNVPADGSATTKPDGYVWMGYTP